MYKNTQAAADKNVNIASNLFLLLLVFENRSFNKSKIIW